MQTFPIDDTGNRVDDSYPTFCERPDPTEDCTMTYRTDRELPFAASVTYRGVLLGRVGLFLSAQYQFRVQRSTSDYENVNRHRASVFATLALPASFTLSLRAALQLNDGVSITDTLTLAEDDENRNVLQAKLAYGVSDSISLEARYALYANQFSTADFSYLRQTVYLGLAFNTGLQ